MGQGTITDDEARKMLEMLKSLFDTVQLWCGQTGQDGMDREISAHESLTAVCPKPYQKNRITKVTTVRVP